jgi:hypothetical protein
VTTVVLTVKVALVAPAGTVTLAGSQAAPSLTDSMTVAPPAGAGPLSVTVPVEEAPPTTVVGFSVSDESVAAAGVTVSEAVRATPLYDAEIVTDVDELTGLVLTAKVAVVAPLATVTLDGTVATLVLLLESDTTAPPLGAGALKVTVPVDEFPPATLAGLTLSEDSVAAAGVTVSEAVRVTPL